MLGSRVTVFEPTPLRVRHRASRSSDTCASFVNRRGRAGQHGSTLRARVGDYLQDLHAAYARKASGRQGESVGCREPGLFERLAYFGHPSRQLAQAFEVSRGKLALLEDVARQVGDPAGNLLAVRALDRQQAFAHEGHRLSRIRAQRFNGATAQGGVAAGQVLPCGFELRRRQRWLRQHAGAEPRQVPDQDGVVQ